MGSAQQTVLMTKRLRLRPSRDADRAPCAALCADPAVMEFFPSTLTRQECDAFIDRIIAGFAERGWGFWAVDVLGGLPDVGTAKLPSIVESQPHRSDYLTKNSTGAEEIGQSEFIGYVGLAIPRFESSFTPCVEVGWRLAKSAWGFGFATEAARAALTFGFETLRLPEIVSFTSILNERSLNVMRRLGMTHDPSSDFDHPNLPPGHRLRRHALYRLRNSQIDAPTPFVVNGSL